MSGQWWRAVAPSALDQFNFGSTERGHLLADIVEEADGEIIGVPRSDAPHSTLIVEDRDGGRARSAYRQGNPGRLCSGIPEVLDRFPPDLVIHDWPADHGDRSVLGEDQ